MKRWMTLLLGCLLLCTACGKKELLGSIALREDTTPEQMIEELSQRYDLPESMLLESAADLAALLQIRKSTCCWVVGVLQPRRTTHSKYYWRRRPWAKRKR